MSSSEDTRSFESAQDILDYLQFAGFDMTRDQIARLHRRRLIDQPISPPSLGRGSVTNYPIGTAERMLRIAQLRHNTKQLDELAWRLWWEGFSIEPGLVRAYLLRKANRWDDQIPEGDPSNSQNGEDEVPRGDRDVLEEVFFQHLKVGPSTNAARKQLERGSELFIEFASLFIDLLRGDLSSLNGSNAGLFDETLRSTGANFDSTKSPGRIALHAMRQEFEVPYSEIIESLDDEGLVRARMVTRQFLGVIANVGDIVQEIFGGAGRGRDNIGKSLVALSESPDEQILSLLLASAFMHDERVLDGIELTQPVSPHAPAISYRDFLRLRYLAQEIPGLANLLSPNRVKKVFETEQGAEEWRTALEQFRLDFAIEFEMAMDLEPALFDDEPPGEDDEEVKIKVKSKKKIQNDHRRH